MYEGCFEGWGGHSVAGGVEEGSEYLGSDEVIVEVVGDKLVLRALKPRIVDTDPGIVEGILREEYGLEGRNSPCHFLFFCVGRAVRCLRLSAFCPVRVFVLRWFLWIR